jgi:D-amino peptidase
MKIAIGLLVILFFTAGIFGQIAEKKGTKIFISVDMEGIWGVVHSEQVTAGSAEYASARKWMAEDVNAVVEGLLEGGATEIVVNDSHGSMRNIIADAIHPKASLVTGSPKPLSMMQGIDPSFDACIFVGYHARAGTTASILDHTISSATVRAIRINNQELPEMGINAAIAGYYRVPVIMLSGDVETCAQARTLLGSEVVTAPVKEAIGRQAARLFPAEEARRRLKEAAREALSKKSKIPLFRLNPPFEFEVEFLNSFQTEQPMLLPQVKRLNPRAVAFTSSDYLEGFKLMRAIIALAGITG